MRQERSLLKVGVGGQARPDFQTSTSAELHPSGQPGIPTSHTTRAFDNQDLRSRIRVAVQRYGPPIPLAAVLGLYILAAFIIPTTANVSISDDWTYVRSVEILHDTGELKVLPVAAAAVVFQTLWAGLFAEVFGMSLGVVRLATVVLTFASGIAMYGLCREVGINQRRSALGAGVYLFNPLAFVIGYSFMSDPYFTALLTISTYYLVKGLRPDNPSSGYTVLASVVISCAFLVRVHGLLILVGAGIYLLVTGRLKVNRASAVLLLQLGLLPVLTTFWYYFIFARGLPSQQDLFWGQAQDAWFDEAWLLVQRLSFIELMYGGLFVVPIAAGALAGIRGSIRFRWPWAWALVGAWGGILILGLRYFGDDDTRLLDPSRHVMPYIPHFLGRAGLGAGDLRYARPDVAGDWFWNGVTAVCAISSIVLAIVLARRVKPGSPRNGGPAGLLLILGVVQAGGVVPQSLLFRNWVISLDRYLLPLLPFAIVLALWALKDARFNEPVAWTVLAILAAVSITSTRDALYVPAERLEHGEVCK